MSHPQLDRMLLKNILLIYENLANIALIYYNLEVAEKLSCRFKRTELSSFAVIKQVHS